MRLWIKTVLALLAILALLWLVTQIGSITLNILSVQRGNEGMRDPQFAEGIEAPTPPPDLFDESNAIEYKDNSANWDTSVQTPVTQTADELGKEAQNALN